MASSSSSGIKGTAPVEISIDSATFVVGKEIGDNIVRTGKVGSDYHFTGLEFDVETVGVG